MAIWIISPGLFLGGSEFYPRLCIFSLLILLRFNSQLNQTKNDQTVQGMKPNVGIYLGIALESEIYSLQIFEFYQL